MSEDTATATATATDEEQQLDEQATEQQESDEVTHISDNKDAAAALGLDIKEFAALKKQGCPAREADGWPILKILDWMAARQNDDDDAGTEDLTGTGEPAAQPEEQPPPDAATDNGVQWVQIMVPVCTPTEPRIATQQFRPNMFRGRIDTRVTDERQLLGLRNSHAGCRSAHVQFPNESHVDRVSDLIKWLCQQIGNEIEASRFVEAPTADQA